MKIKALLLGSVAAAGLSSAAFAADMPQAMTSLDVCDALGLSGLTISSDSNCLQISGSIEYKFKWGDFSSTDFAGVFNSEYGVNNDNRSYTVDAGNDYTNWESILETHLNVIATADSDFGPAKAVIKLKQKSDVTTRWGTDATGSGGTQAGGSTTSGYMSTEGDGGTNVYIDKAYVSVGDSTVLMAGKTDSIANLGDDTPFNYLGLFNSEAVNTGVLWNNGIVPGMNADGRTEIRTGGYSIQVMSDLGNGVSVGAGLENLDGSSGKIGGNPNAQDQNGTFVGVMQYAGDNLTAHATIAVTNVLGSGTGAPDRQWAIHTGATATMDNFKLRGALAANSNSWWDGLVTGEATFDMFTLAASAEATSEDEWGAGGSVTAQLTDTVKLNVGGRYFNFNNNYDNLDAWEAAAALTADVTESLSLTGKVGWLSRGDGFPGGLGVFGSNPVTGSDSVTYGSVAANWAPGGGFTSSVTAEMNSESAYKITFDAKKEFK